VNDGANFGTIHTTATANRQNQGAIRVTFTTDINVEPRLNSARRFRFADDDVSKVQESSMRSFVTEAGGKVHERTGWLTLTESVLGSGKAWFSRVLWACRSELVRTLAVALEAGHREAQLPPPWSHQHWD